MLLVVLGFLVGFTARAAAAEGAAEGGDAAMHGAAADDDEDAPADPADPAAGEADMTLSAILDGPDDDRADDVAHDFAHDGARFDDELRRQRPSRWGRLDFAVTWRRKLDDGAPGAPRADELWLLAIWSR